MRHGFGPTILHALPRAPPGASIKELVGKLDAQHPRPGTGTIRRHLNRLVDMDIVVRDVGARGLSRYWRLTDSILDSFEFTVDAEEFHA